MLVMAFRMRVAPLALFTKTLCFLVLIGVGICFSGCRDSGNLDAAQAVVGELAPELSLPGMDGRQIVLSHFRGKKVLLAFWASWCPPCQTEMSSLQRLHDNPAERNLTILAVNVGESKKQISSFIARQKLSLPILIDAEGIAQKRYGVNQLPVVFLVDGQGKIIARHLGLRDWNSMDVITELNQLGGE